MHRDNTAATANHAVYVRWNHPAESPGFSLRALKLMIVSLDLQQPSLRIKTHFSSLGDTNCQQSESLPQRREPPGRGHVGR